LASMSQLTTAERAWLGRALDHAARFRTRATDTTNRPDEKRWRDWRALRRLTARIDATIEKAKPSREGL
jgi:hypothetical protein